MRTNHLLLALVLAACTKASSTNETSNRDRGAAPRAKATVTLTSVAFADDCGGTPPHTAPIAPAQLAAPAEPPDNAPAAAAVPLDVAARRRCEQTVRNYDPCISCATHFLDLRIDRG